MNRSCKWVREKIDEYLDESLTGIQLKDFEEHIVKCENCREELNEMRYILSLTKEIEDVTPPEDFTRQVMKKVSIESEKKKKSFFVYAKYGAPIIAALIVVAFIYIFNDGIFMMKGNKISENNSINNSADANIQAANRAQDDENFGGSENTNNNSVGRNDAIAYIVEDEATQEENGNGLDEDMPNEPNHDTEKEEVNDSNSNSHNESNQIELDNYEMRNYSRVKMNVIPKGNIIETTKEIEMIITEYDIEYNQYFYNEESFIVENTAEDIYSSKLIFQIDYISGEEILESLTEKYEVLIIPYEKEEKEDSLEMIIDIISN